MPFLGLNEDEPLDHIEQAEADQKHEGKLEQLPSEGKVAPVAGNQIGSHCATNDEGS